MRAIDGDALKDRLQSLAYDDWNQGVTTSWADAYRECADMVEEQPTIEPEPEKGRWIKCEDRAGWYCSECATDDYYAYLYNSDTGVYELQDKFCPSCGARMEE